MLLNIFSSTPQAPADQNQGSAKRRRDFNSDTKESFRAKRRLGDKKTAGNANHSAKFDKNRNRRDNHGVHEEGKTWNGEKKTFAKKPFEKKSFGDKPFEKKSYGSKPFENKPYDGQSSEKKSYDGKSSDKKSFDKRSRDNRNSFKNDSSASKPTAEESKTTAEIEDKSKFIVQSKTAHHKVHIPETLKELPQLQLRSAENLSKQDMNKVGRDFDRITASKEKTFKGLGLPERLVTHLEASGYGKPTGIQSRSIPALAGHRDALIKSQTGSGKTLAYLLPILRHLGELPTRLERSDGTKAIILTPTRELAVQIENVYRIVAKPYYWIVASTLMGGENKKAEKSRLRKGAHIIIGTPGRIRDHIESTQSWNLSRVRWFILDEADRLIDLGFEETVRFIFNYINNLTNKNRIDERQRNVLVSATLSKGTAVDRLAGEIMKNPVFIGFNEDEGEEDRENQENDTSQRLPGTEVDAQPPREIDTEVSTDNSTDNSSTSEIVATDDEPAAIIHSTPASLEQLYVQMSTRHRLVALASFLRLRICTAQRTGTKFKAIVFVSTCAEVEFLHKIFSHTFWPDYESEQSPIVVTKDEEEVVQKAKTEEERDADRKRREKDEVASREASTPAQQPRIPLLDTQLWKLHGNMHQKTRTTTYFEFSRAAEGILFCTDVAARGLDLPAVDWIVQYDAPEDTEDYIHRVGRTARIGHEGKAIIFLVESELEYLTVLRRHGITLTPFTLERVLGGLHVGIQRTVAQQQQSSRLPSGALLQKQLETMVTVSPDLSDLAKEAYVSYLRAYAAYPKALKPIFHTKKLHFGEVAHSFALTERPSEVGKKAAEVHTQTRSTVNPVAAKAAAGPKINYGPAGPPAGPPQMSKADAQREKYAGKTGARGAAKQLSYHQIAKKQAKQSDLAEFM